MNSWYTIRALATGAEVVIYDEIGAYEACMKLRLDIGPDIVATMAAEVAAGERAVTAAMRGAGTGLKSSWRTQIA